MTYRGKIRGNVVVLEQEVKLPDGTAVLVETESNGSPTTSGDADALFRMGEFAVETGIADLAANADHYLYGHPKVNHG